MQHFITIELRDDIDSDEFIKLSKQVPDLQVTFACTKKHGYIALRIEADDIQKFYLLGLVTQPMFAQRYATPDTNASIQITEMPDLPFRLFDKVIVSEEATGYGDIPGHVSEIDWNDISQEHFFLIIGTGVLGDGKRFYVQEKFLKHI